MAEKISILFLVMMVLMNNNRLGQQLTKQELQVVREARVRLYAERTAFYDNMISTEYEVIPNWNIMFLII